MQVHPKQISGLYGTLYDQLMVLDLDIVSADVEYVYVDGKVTTETVYDITPTPRVVIKTSTYAYLANGNVDTETITKNGVTFVKKFIYNPDGAVTKIEVRKTV